MSEPATPFIFHDNGRNTLKAENLGRFYFGLIERHFFRERRDFACPQNLEIILCHNYRDKPLTQRALEQIGISNATVLGQNVEHWLHTLKIDLVLEHLKSKSGGEFVLFMDSADVLITADPARVLERFLCAFDCDLLFCAEKISSPGTRPPGSATTASRRYADRTPADADWSADDWQILRRVEEFEEAVYAGPFRHLNAGCYIGRRTFLIEFLEQATALKGFVSSAGRAGCDQIVFRELHRRHYPRVQVDSKCSLFLCLFWTRREEILTECDLDGIGARAFVLWQLLAARTRKWSRRAKKELARTIG